MKNSTHLAIKYFCLHLFLLVLCSCETIEEKDIYGNWEAVSLVEKDSILALDLEEVQLLFTERYYRFSSTLNYQEAGTYRLASQLLITKDTTREYSKEKTVEIIRLHQDSLYLRMNEQGKERRLTLVKKTNKGAGNN